MFEATLYVNTHLLKICLKQSNQSNPSNPRQVSGGASYLGSNRVNSRQDRSQKQDQSSDMNTISFKYTIDYPKIELNPFDTKKMAILYNEQEYGIQGSSALNRLSQMNRLND